jgi:hypothetical protein
MQNRFSSIWLAATGLSTSFFIKKAYCRSFSDDRKQNISDVEKPTGFFWGGGQQIQAITSAWLMGVRPSFLAFGAHHAAAISREGKIFY